MVGRLLTGIAAGLLLFGLVFGAAASLSTSSLGTVGAVSATVASCDTDGIGIAFTDSGLNLGDVVVSGIHDDCDGLTLTATIGASVVTGTITATGTDDASVTLDFSGELITLASLTGVDITIL